MHKGYLDLSYGQLHYASAGNVGPRIVLLHESPLSHRMFTDAIASMSTWSQIFTPDTPGYGQSDPLKVTPGMDVYAQILSEGICKWSDDGEVIIVGVHTGASLAVEIANQIPQICKGLYLIGLPTYSDEMRQSRIESYSPSIELDDEGSHAVWAWDRYRKMWPTAPIAQVQQATADLFYNLERYNLAYLEAFKYSAEERLKNLRCPVVLSAAENEFLHAGTQELALREGIEFHTFPGIDWQGQVPMRNPKEMDREIRKFADKIS